MRKTLKLPEGYWVGWRSARDGRCVLYSGDPVQRPDDGEFAGSRAVASFEFDVPDSLIERVALLDHIARSGRRDAWVARRALAQVFQRGR